MLSALPPREREIVDILYERGPSLVSEVRESLPDPLSDSAVRAMLKRLEDKGFVERSSGERGLVFAPRVSGKAARRSALSQIVRVFFNGSPASAASALLGMTDKLDDRELDDLERAIAEARNGRN
jgi:predicted transcriptional regulator